MKICLIDTSDVIPKTSVNVHLSNCLIIQDYLKRNDFEVDLFVGSSVINTKTQYDIILISYGSFYFDFKKFVELIENQKSCKIGWLTNDYDLTPNSCFNKYFDFIISNHFTKLKMFQDKKQLMCNLNALISYETEFENKRKYDIIYYGTYRKGRENYFLHYFKDKSIYLSCSSKNMKKYKHLGCNVKFIDKLNWQKGKETLRLFEKSLYIEDVATHSYFSHFANRFYESISCESLPLFDENCKNTIKKSTAYKIPEELIISSHKDFSRIKYNDFKNWIKTTQRIIMNEKSEVLNHIKEFLQIV